MADDDRPLFLPPTADPPRFGVAGLPSPDPPSPGHPARNYSATDPGLPRQRVVAAPEPSNGYAVASLTLSVVGLGLFVITISVGAFLSVWCSLLGWILGQRARSRPGDERIAVAGVLLGIVGTAVGLIGVVVWGTLLLAAGGPAVGA